jgi:hypothetical protein
MRRWLLKDRLAPPFGRTRLGLPRTHRALARQAPSPDDIERRINCDFVYAREAGMVNSISVPESGVTASAGATAPPAAPDSN